jgi:hypothetical protein
MKDCEHYAEDWGSAYLAHAADAERRMAAGEKQRRCPVCKLWIWESFWPVKVPQPQP